jgi:hypothetical protein
MTHVTEHDQERAAIEAAHEAVGRLMDEWMEMNRELRAIGRGRPYDVAHPDWRPDGLTDSRAASTTSSRTGSPPRPPSQILASSTLASGGLCLRTTLSNRFTSWTPTQTSSSSAPTPATVAGPCTRQGLRTSRSPAGTHPS